MAVQSVATATSPLASGGSKHDLWIGREVLAIQIDCKDKSYPPARPQCENLNRMIQGLARAAKAVVHQSENDTSQAADFAIQPVDDIADAIILLSQMSEAIRLEIESSGG